MTYSSRYGARSRSASREPSSTSSAPSARSSAWYVVFRVAMVALWDDATSEPSRVSKKAAPTGTSSMVAAARAEARATFIRSTWVDDGRDKWIPGKERTDPGEEGASYTNSPLTKT